MEQAWAEARPELIMVPTPPPKLASRQLPAREEQAAPPAELLRCPEFPCPGGAASSPSTSAPALAAAIRIFPAVPRSRTSTSWASVFKALPVRAEHLIFTICYQRLPATTCILGRRHRPSCGIPNRRQLEELPVRSRFPRRFTPSCPLDYRARAW